MLSIGDHVIYDRKGSAGRVVWIGKCDYGRCQNGDQCVLVAPDMGGLSRNFHADHLTLIGE